MLKKDLLCNLKCDKSIRCPKDNKLLFKQNNIVFEIKCGRCKTTYVFIKNNKFNK